MIPSSYIMLVFDPPYATHVIVGLLVAWYSWANFHPGLQIVNSSTKKTYNFGRMFVEHIYLETVIFF
jgi:hypothetical protein